MNNDVLDLWPELMWIQDENLRKKVAKTWELALEKSVLTSDDLEKIPFTLLCGPDLKVTFMDHKRSVVYIARDAGQKINEMYHGELTVDMDVLIAGAILCVKTDRWSRAAMVNICGTLSPEFRWLNSVAFRQRCAILSLPMPVKAI